MSERAVPAEVWAVASAKEIELTSPAEQESLVKMQVLCPPDFLRYLWEEDDVLVNFGRGYVRFQRRHFLAAVAEVLPDLLQATLSRERPKDREGGPVGPSTS